MVILRSEDELARELIELTTRKPTLRIGIDGIDGAGKSSLAAFLATKIPCAIISLDTHIAKNQGRYISSLRADDIRCKIDACSGVIIVEGVCLLDALEIVGIGVDCMIYVKRMGAGGWWQDEDELVPSTDVDAHIQGLEDDLRASTQFIDDASEKLAMPDLSKEIIRYHARRRPQESAGFVLERIDA